MELIVENYVKKLAGNRVLDDVSITFHSGKIYGLRGKNGCGKTMFMRAVSGLIRPTSGRIIIDGKVVHKDMEFPPSIGAMIENPAFFKEYSGRKNLEILSELSGKVDHGEIEDVIEKTGLTENADKLYGRYSLGMKQKLGIAFAILNEPDIILLDEPINALDEQSVEKIKSVLLDLRDKGKLIILACHDREELDYLSDEIFIMKDGKIVGKEEL